MQQNATNMIIIMNNLINSNNLDTKLNQNQNHYTPGKDLILIDSITSGGSHNCMLLDAGMIVCLGWNS